jgi:hypothetical protein
LQELLQEIPTFVGNNYIFWTWMDSQATIDQLMDIWIHLRNKLPASNGYIASFNPLLSLCVGAHNNASLLGSIGQAKAALFYLIPYQVHECW